MLQVILLPFVALSVGLSTPPVAHLEVIQANSSLLQPYIAPKYEDEVTSGLKVQGTTTPQLALNGVFAQSVGLNIIVNGGYELLYGHGLRELHYE